MLSAIVLKTGRLALEGSNLAVQCHSGFSRVLVGRFPSKPCQGQDDQSEHQLGAAECKL